MKGASAVLPMTCLVPWFSIMIMKMCPGAPFAAADGAAMDARAGMEADACVVTTPTPRPSAASATPPARIQRRDRDDLTMGVLLKGLREKARTAHTMATEAGN